MNTFYDLTISPGYVSDWTWWQVFREFIQNGLDGKDQGFPLDITRNLNGTLVISNKGAILTPKDLLIGSTSKSDGNSRGKFGEGFKLAMLVACRKQLEEGRKDCPIKIKTGNMIWHPKLIKSQKYDSEILRIEETLGKDDGYLSVYIYNVSDEMWTTIQDNILTLSSPHKIKTERGDILLSEKYRGKLYLKDIFVSKLEEDCLYGYNLHNLKIDRDRKLADPYQLKREIAYTLNAAICDGMSADLIYKAFIDQNKKFETESVRLTFGGCDTFINTKLHEMWKLENPEAFPVYQQEDVELVSTWGQQVARVSYDFHQMIYEFFDPLNDIKNKLSKSIKKVYNSNELLDLENENISCLKTIFKTICERQAFDFNNLQIVDFNGPLLGLYDGLTLKISISRISTTNLVSLLSVFLHELGHHIGGADFTQKHVDNIADTAGFVMKELFQKTLNT